MQAPELDEEGKFKPVMRPGSMAARMVAKLVDAFVCGVTIFGFTRSTSPLIATTIGVGWFLLADWSGSPGKWLFRLKTVTLEGQPISLVMSLKRNFLLGLPSLARGFMMAGLIGLQGEHAVYDRGFLGCVGLSIALAELFGMFTHPESRRWGDIFARTRVVVRA